MAHKPKKRSARVASPTGEVSLQQPAQDFAAVRAKGAAGEDLAKAERIALQLVVAVDQVLSTHALAIEPWELQALEHLKTTVLCGRAQLAGHQKFLLATVGRSEEVSHG